MFNWLTERLLHGMMEEEKCWRVHADFDTDSYVASDFHRALSVAPSLAEICLDHVENFRVVGKGNEGYEEVKMYVRFRVAKAGLLFMLQVWKRMP